MFEKEKKYTHKKIKEFFEINKGSSILEGGKSKKFVALCISRIIYLKISEQI